MISLSHWGMFALAQATLTWEPEAKPDANCPYDHTAAATPFGTYQITWKSWKDYPSYYVDFEGRFVTTDNDLSYAKDAALVDFNKRLRACGASSVPADGQCER